jgi:hypothetical protein
LTIESCQMMFLERSWGVAFDPQTSAMYLLLAIVIHNPRNKKSSTANCNIIVCYVGMVSTTSRNLWQSRAVHKSKCNFLSSGCLPLTMPGFGGYLKPMFVDHNKWVEGGCRHDLFLNYVFEISFSARNKCQTGTWEGVGNEGAPLAALESSSALFIKS